ncbi:hypothetical protein EMIT0P171_40354 [Pseudomonas sp. IT-P171]
MQDHPLLADRGVKRSGSPSAPPAGNHHTESPSQAILITDQKKRQSAALTLNEQTSLNREDLVISDVHNRLGFLLLIRLG